jgi:ribonuclease HII
MSIKSPHEDAYRTDGLAIVAGLDEVGRGPLAGPVMAAAVIIGDDARVRRRLRMQAGDSKVLSPEAREEVAAFVREHCLVGVGEASVAEIDGINIRQASLLAMCRAVAALPAVPQAVLVDGLDVPAQLTMPGRAIVGGDAVEMCIACASIVAKVARDALMAELARFHPHFGWEHNAGYGTPFHLEALRLHGATPHHRRSFAPVRARLEAAA